MASLAWLWSVAGESLSRHSYTVSGRSRIQVGSARLRRTNHAIVADVPRALLGQASVVDVGGGMGMHSSLFPSSHTPLHIQGLISCQTLTCFASSYFTSAPNSTLALMSVNLKIGRGETVLWLSKNPGSTEADAVCSVRLSHREPCQ